jgi:alpha-L-fucosidase
VTLRLLIALALVALLVAAHGQSDKDGRMDWWREARFGLFIHWGTYSVLAGEWQGKKDHGEWIRESAQIPIEQYTPIKDRFNPTRFDAGEWARTAKDAGMKYVVITTKHHEGFALFDSAVSDYDVMATPFQRDLMKELAEACAEEGLRMGWYYSIMDWHHPDYLPRRAWELAHRPAAGADMDRYVEFMHRQVEELLTRYGPIGVMWFDGEWEPTWNHARGQALYDLCRRLQPDVIVNNRVDVGRGGMAGMSDAGFAGDFGTPEQEVPRTGLPGVDWETCMTMNDHWGFCRADLNYKSTGELLRTLCDVASKGGNFLLNVGPTPEGEFPPESVERLGEIGQWMRANGDAVYGTLAGPFESLPWGRCTARGNHLYFHVFDWPKDGRLVVPGLGSEVESARILATDSGLQARREGPDVVVLVPQEAPHPEVSVVELVVAGGPVVYTAPKIEPPAPFMVRPMPVRVTVGPGIEARYTLDGSDPTLDSPVAGERVTMERPGTLKVRGFHDGQAVTRVVEATVAQAEPLAPAETGEVEPGLAVSQWRGEWDKTPDFSKLGPPERLTATGFTVADIPDMERVARVYEGYLDVAAEDVYVFALRSDDGSRLWVGGRLVVDNDGLHSPLEKTGAVALERGRHRIRVEWFNKTGGLDLALRMGAAGEELRPVGSERLSRPRG